MAVPCSVSSDNDMHFYMSAVTEYDATLLLLLEKEIISGRNHKPHSKGTNASNHPGSLEKSLVERRPLHLGTASNNNDERLLKPAPGCFSSIAADQVEGIIVSGIRAACKSPDFNPALDFNMYDPVRRVTCLLPAPPPARYLKRRKT